MFLLEKSLKNEGHNGIVPLVFIVLRRVYSSAVEKMRALCYANGTSVMVIRLILAHVPAEQRS